MGRAPLALALALGGCAARTPATPLPRIVDVEIVEGEAVEEAGMRAERPAEPEVDAYLRSHGIQRANDRLGGPLQVRLRQVTGGVYAIRPAKNAPDLASSLQGDSFVTMLRADLDATLTDLTATDAGVTEDQAALQARWEDAKGHVYEVRCCTALWSRGDDYPTFGGVATNTLIHGFTGVGDPQVPAVFAYAAMWGTGQVLKDGQVVAESAPVHLALTESLRDDDLRRVDPADVDPMRRELHLWVGGQEPLATGYTLPSGDELPFWHILFPAYRLEVALPGADGAGPNR